jgi:hypothetical protein
MKILGTYTNGNYQVSIYNDGTKVRENELDNLTPSFPENIDLKITDYCDRGCAFCHENSTVKGLHGDILNQEFIKTLSPYTELALGGGNPIDHPDLVEFLQELKDRNIIANITVNQKHFLDNQDIISYLVEHELIYGLGVSVTEVSDLLIEKLKQFPNVVIHVIYGVIPQEELTKLYGQGLKLLILGYKIFRRGELWLAKKEHEHEFEVNSMWMYDNLSNITKNFMVTSFDNLAIRQLEVVRLMTKEKWDRFYMGDDGQYTMYIDLVRREYASSSTSITRHPLEQSILPMFNTVRSEQVS